MVATTNFSVDTFKGKFDGGARPNLFEVSITDFGMTADDMYLCKATSLPASTVAAIDVPFRGRIVKVSGDRTFEDWTVTFINNESFGIRTKFEQWMNDNLNDHEQNIQGETNPNDYKKDMTVRQLSKDGSTVLASYTIKGAFPTTIDAIELSNDSGDTIEEFNVTFSYDYWVRSDE